VLIYIIPATGVDNRLDSAWSDVDNYLTGKTIDTSLGIRFESWRAAFYMLEEHPLFGVGLGRFQQEAQDLIDKGSVREGAADFNHTHNDYIYQLSVNGVVGFVFLFLVYIYPLRLFYKNIFFGDPEIKALSIAGLCFVVAFMHYSLSETLMIRSLPVSLYNFFIFVLLALIYNKKTIIRKQLIEKTY
jgi:O-antigen ligase